MLNYHYDSHVAVIEFQRHEKRNALTRDMILSFSEALEDAVKDHARVIVITGAGSTFSAGADLDIALYDQDFLINHVNVITKMQKISAPIIAAINGPALGAGFQLAMACDIRIMDPKAKIGIPAPKIGVTVDSWTIKRFANLVGWGHARSLLFCLEEFTAEKCLNIGFANRIDTKDAAIDFAHMLSLLAPLTLQHYKLVLNDDGALDTVSDELYQAMVAVWTSNDVTVGKHARKEGIFPLFTGN